MNRLYRKFKNYTIRKKAKPEYWIKKELPQVVHYKELLGSGFTGPLLDLGCGADYFSQACRLQQVQADGIDLDTCDFEKDILPFRDESMSVITMNEVIEHIWDPKHIFREINRVLKKEGYLIIKTHNWKWSWRTFYDDPTRKRPYTKEALTKIFMVFGMKIIIFERGVFPWQKKIIAIAQKVK